MIKNFIFYTRYRFSFLTSGDPLSFIYNNHSSPTYGSETKFRTKVLCLLSFKKVSEKSLIKNFIFCTRYRFSFLTSGDLLSFIYNNHSSPTYGSETKFRTKVLYLLSFKKVSEKSLIKNFIFCTWYRFSFLTSGDPLSFIYNNHSSPTYGSETKFRTKVLCLLSFKKVSEKSLTKSFIFCT